MAKTAKNGGKHTAFLKIKWGGFKVRISASGKARKTAIRLGFLILLALGGLFGASHSATAHALIERFFEAWHSLSHKAEPPPPPNVKAPGLPVGPSHLGYRGRQHPQGSRGEAGRICSCEGHRR